MRGFERVHDVDRGAEGVLERQRPAHRRSLEVLHHQVVRADVVEDADVRMAQRRDGARFLEKTLAVTAVERLDGHRSAEAGVDGLVDLAHATRAQHGHDFIRTEAGTRSQRQCEGTIILCAFAGPSCDAPPLSAYVASTAFKAIARVNRVSATSRAA